MNINLFTGFTTNIYLLKNDNFYKEKKNMNVFTIKNRILEILGDVGFTQFKHTYMSRQAD